VISYVPTFTQAWWLLSIAIFFEICGTVCMRLSDGFTRLTPSVLIFVFYAFSFALNTLVVRVLGLSVVYAVWSGVGTVITATIGIWYFKEPVTALKLASIGLVVIGVLGLHASSNATR
jgi:small multidrug resistance pump